MTTFAAARGRADRYCRGLIFATWNPQAPPLTQELGPMAAAGSPGRRDHADYLFTGQRIDIVRRIDAALRFAWRRIVLDNTVLPASKIGVFF